MTRIENYNYYNNYENPNNYYYKQRNPLLAEVGLVAATLATGLVYKALPSFSNPFIKQITKEHQNNDIYKDIFQKAIKNSKLQDQGLQVIHTTDTTTDIGKGLNASFYPDQKIIKLNKDKASISGFHELGHAMNNMNKGWGRFLQKLRKPGQSIAGLMLTVALLVRNKPKEADKTPLDYIQDNCGKIAFLGMMPTVIEETMASYKGIKAAKEAGLAKAHIKNLHKFYLKALLSYGGYALVSGVAVFVASKIMEKFTRPKKVEY